MDKFLWNYQENPERVTSMGSVPESDSNAAALQRAQALQHLSEMGLYVEPKLLQPGDRGYQPPRIHKISVETMPGREILGIDKSSIDTSQIKSEVPEMKKWSDDEIQTWMIHPDGYASYLNSGGDPVDILSSTVASTYRTYQQNQQKQTPADQRLQIGQTLEGKSTDPDDTYPWDEEGPQEAGWVKELTSPIVTPTEKPTESPTKPATTIGPEEKKEDPTTTPPEGVTEKLMNPGVSSGSQKETQDQNPMVGELRPSMKTGGSDDLKLTEKQDQVNEDRIMTEMVLKGTEWDDRNNKLKIEEERNFAIRMYKPSLINPVYAGDQFNYELLSDWAKPSLPKKVPKRRAVNYEAIPTQASPPDGYKQTVQAARYGGYPFHSVYSNLTEPILPDNTRVY